jgi:hypothetical protein
MTIFHAYRPRGALARGLVLGAAAYLAAGLTAHGARAETRGYAVSWFYMSAISQDDDCPGGPSPASEVMARKWLADAGKTPAEIEELYKGFPISIYPTIRMRGRDKNGEPLNIYTNPTSIPDPNIKTLTGHTAYGFNLDGKDGPNDFVDPETGEHGVDNKMYRAVGCFVTQRANAPQRPTWPAIQWDMTRDQMPAWVLEVSGIARDAGGKIKDGDVKLGIYRATGPVTRNAAGDPQADMSYSVDSDPRMQNLVHASMHNGMLTTDMFEFFMVMDPFGVGTYHFKKAKIRLTLNDDGTARGVLGGYLPWLPVYESFALGGANNEANLSVDTPGIYYAMKKFADYDPDSTGQNQSISSSYIIEAVPAFVSHPNADKTAMTAGPVRLAGTGR